MGHLYEALRAGVRGFKLGSEPSEFSIAGRVVKCPHCGETKFMPAPAMVNAVLMAPPARLVALGTGVGAGGRRWAHRVERMKDLISAVRDVVRALKKPFRAADVTSLGRCLRFRVAR